MNTSAANATEIIAYHGTNERGTIDRFFSLCHFGTERAAADLLTLNGRRRAKPTARIYRVRLNVRNPLEIADTGEDHRFSGLTRAIVAAGAMTESERQELRSSGPDAEWRLAELLEGRGYDGLTYLNATEDRGSRSYVILRGAQAEILDSKSLA